MLEREDKEIGDLRDFVQASIAKDEARQEEERRSRDQQQHKELVLARRLAEEEAARADTAETLAQEQAARSKATKRTYAISSLFGFMLLIVVAAFAVTQSRSLDQQARSLEQLSLAHEETAHRLKEAQIAQSHLLAQLSQRKTGSGDAAAGILLALEALPRDQSDSRPVVPEAFAALMQASLSIRERAVLKHQDLVGAVAVSPDGRIVATASDDNVGPNLGCDKQPGARGAQAPRLGECYRLLARRSICSNRIFRRDSPGLGYDKPTGARVQPWWRGKGRWLFAGRPRIGDRIRRQGGPDLGCDNGRSS